MIRNKIRTFPGPFLVIPGIVMMLGGTRPIVADDAPQRAENGDPLVVRDVAVYLLSAYGTQLNERGLFTSTLPSYTLSRRPSADRDSWNKPTPAGIITFAGPAEDDVDALLEFDKGRFLSHWPPGRLRSKRLLWASIDLSIEPVKEPSIMPDGHWLHPLRESGRLYPVGNKHSARYLLYDVELPYAPHVMLQRAEGGYTITNSGRHPIHDVVIYRPSGADQWEVAATAQVGAAVKMEQKDDEAAKPVGSTPVPEKSASPQPQPAAAAPVAVKAAVAEAAAADLVEAPQKPEADTNDKAAADKPEEKPVAGTTAPASIVGVQTADEAMKSWAQSLTQLQLEQPEIDFVLGILRQQALRSESAMLVYRLDETHLEKLLPLEVTPFPDRLFRVALVIVQDADPDLQSQIESLVTQLGNDKWRQREQAHEELSELGLAAKPKLEAALKHKDAEIVFRAEQLLEAIKANQ